MKKLFISASIYIALFGACTNSQQKDPVTAIKKDKPDTVKIDYAANRDMLIILSIMPDSITKSWQWTKQERIDMHESVEARNYFIDSTANYSTIKQFRNDYIDIQAEDGTFELSAYQIADGRYIILTKEQVGDGQYVNAYELYKISAALLPLTEILGQYTNHFLKDTTNKNCFELFKNKQPNLDFDIKDPGKVHITIKDPNKNNIADCLKGDSLTLVFDKTIKPFQFESIKWTDKNP